MFVKPNPKLIKFLARAPQSQALPIRKAIRNLSELTKLKLSVLNSIVTVSAYCLYPVPISCIPLFFSSLALSMSTQVLNQTIEAEYDKLMVRTSQRPMVQNIFSRPFALGLGSALGAAGIYGLSWYSAKTAIIGAVIWVGYLAVYTRMKRHSLLNTYFGAIVGSLTVYLGWVAANRSICMVEPFAMFLYMMAWQHQHFYGIRWVYFDDYNNAGFKMQRSKHIASLITISQIILAMFFVNYSLKYSQINYGMILNVVMTVGLYKWGIESMVKFDRGQVDAKTIKMQSYKHFCLFFGILFLNFLYRWYKGEEWKKPRNIMKEQCIFPYL